MLDSEFAEICRESRMDSRKLLGKRKKNVMNKDNLGQCGIKYSYPIIIKNGIKMLRGAFNNDSVKMCKAEYAATDTGEKYKCQYNNLVPLLFSKKEDCCGCAACYAICSLGAIRMLQDEEGFEYPSIDAEKCVRCGKCIEICPIKAMNITDSKK